MRRLIFFTPLLALNLLLFAAPAMAGKIATATFAGGCFWCMEQALDEVDGVLSTTSGYAGGSVKNPSYQQVSGGGTGHAEAVQITYDPDKVSYGELLTKFWHNIDPIVPNQQFCDGGSQYRSAIFYHDEAQREIAERSLAEIEKSKPFPGKVVTQIAALTEFYPAEGYHQDYYKKNPVRYKLYKYGCGRAQRLKQLWGDEAGKGA